MSAQPEGLTVRAPAKALLLILIRGYQYLLRPMLGSNCRFYPSCSDYARDAVLAHGAGRGSWLAVRRVCRCHPYHPGGFDPVPPAADKGARDLARDMHRS